MGSELVGNRIGTGPPTRLQRIIWKFELVVVTALELLIVLTVAVATVKLFVLFIEAMRTQIPQIDSADTLQPVLQNAYSGILLVLLGLELLQTLKAYFGEHHLQIEVILVVAMIAVGRHIIQADIGHARGAELAGLAILIASLAGSYYLVKKTHIKLPRVNPQPRPTNETPDV
jgi:uncharacterized membrane protein (DUF373 family)